MARDFVSATPDYLHVDQAPVTALPFSMACWFNADNITANHALLWIGDKDVGNTYFSLEASGAVAGDSIRLRARENSGASNLKTTTAYSASTWHHACASCNTNIDRSVYLDGGGKNTSTVDRDALNWDRFSVGMYRDSTPDTAADAIIAEAAIWNAALTDAEVALLAQPVSPLLIRPDALVAYWPIIGRYSPEIDRWGGFDMTVTGAAAAAHPRMFYPAGVSIIGVPAVAAGFVPYPNPRYALTGGMQPMDGGV